MSKETNSDALKFDSNFIRPIVEGAVHTLEIQCSVAAKVQPPHVKGSKVEANADIAAIIGLTSRTFTGTIAVTFPRETFLGIMNKMLGENFSEITSDLEDGVSELLNIIFGQAKKVLNEEGHGVEMAIPTIIRGTNVKVRHLTEKMAVVLPFESEVGPFTMEIAKQPTKAS